MQITVSVNGTPELIVIPQSWHELPWMNYVNAVAAPDGHVFKELEALTGIKAEVIEAMIPDHQRFILNQCAFFWNSPPPIEPIPFQFIKNQIAQGTWQQLINSEQEFKRVNELSLPSIAAAQLIIKTYTKHPCIKDSGVDIKSMKVPEAMGYWDFFFGSSQIGKNDG